MLDEQITNGLSQEEAASLMKQLLASNPEAFASFLKEDEGARRAAKAVVGTTGRTREPSFLTDKLEIGLLAMAETLDADIVDGDDAATVSNVLASLVGYIREKKDGAGTQEAYTLSYEADGISHRVRFTIMSETAAADSVLRKALDTITAATPDSLEADVSKWRKSIKRQRVDSKVRDEHLASFNQAVAERTAVISGGDNGATSAPPPAPPA